MGRPPVGNHAMSGAERQRKYRAQFSRTMPEPVPKSVSNEIAGRNRKLETQITERDKALALAQTRIAELERELKTRPKSQASYDSFMLERELRQAEHEIAQLKAKLAKPKTENPPLPPDEERDRIIKGLKTANQNLRLKIRRMDQWNAQQEKNAGKMKMPFATMSAITKALHPDREPSTAERDTALKLFTAWTRTGKPAADNRENPK